MVDIGWETTEAEAALYEAPFGYVREHVWPMRQRNRLDEECSACGGSDYAPREGCDSLFFALREGGTGAAPAFAAQ